VVRHHRLFGGRANMRRRGENLVVVELMWIGRILISSWHQSGIGVRNIINISKTYNGGVKMDEDSLAADSGVVAAAAAADGNLARRRLALVPDPSPGV